VADETVHNSRFSERLAFEVSIDGSEVLSLVKQISVKTRELTELSNQLIAAMRVAEENQGR